MYEIKQMNSQTIRYLIQRYLFVLAYQFIYSGENVRSLNNKLPYTGQHIA